MREVCYGLFLVNSKSFVDNNRWWCDDGDYYFDYIKKSKIIALIIIICSYSYWVYFMFQSEIWI